jgi:hypothetical protein
MLAFSGADAEVTALAADASGAVYLTGFTAGGLPVVNAFQSGLTGTINALAAALNGKTGALQYLTHLGGGNDGASSIAADPDGDAYVAGGDVLA